MIIGVDHLAFSVENTWEELPFRDFDYELSFAEESLENHIAKKDFLTQYSAEHGICYWKHPDSIAIECTHHIPCAFPAKGSYYPVFSIKELGLKEGRSVFEGMDVIDGPILVVQLNDLVRSCGLIKGDADGLMCIMLNTHDLSRSLNFWIKGLGFQLVSREEDRVRIRKTAMFRHWQVDLILIESKRKKMNGYLDADGFTCLAFLSTNIQDDAAVLYSYGAKNITASFTLAVNSKGLRLMLLRSPEGAPVELMQGF